MINANLFQLVYKIIGREWIMGLIVKTFSIAFYFLSNIHKFFVCWIHKTSINFIIIRSKVKNMLTCCIFDKLTDWNEVRCMNFSLYSLFKINIGTMKVTIVRIIRTSIFICCKKWGKKRFPSYFAYLFRFLFWVIILSKMNGFNND